MSRSRPTARRNVLSYCYSYGYSSKVLLSSRRSSRGVNRMKGCSGHELLQNVLIARKKSYLVVVSKQKNDCSLYKLHKDIFPQCLA
jgi:hypothetical protein